MNTLELTKKLVSLPSYVGPKNSEKPLADFVFNYLKKIPFLKEIKKQKVEGERFNIIAGDGFKTKLLLMAHLDTVEPRGWKKNPFGPTIKGNRLIGLGSMDMKGGMAAILASLKEFKRTKGLKLLFYCDEEYDFKGMKKFIEEYKFRPQLAVSAEPTDLKIWNGARGIIKVSFRIKGLTAPASRPDLGKNAILGLVGAADYLSESLKKYKTKNLGFSTCNLAAVSGGLNLGQVISQKGDAVPDVAEGLLDIRSGHLLLSAKIIKKILKKFLTKNGFQLLNFKIYHELKTFYTSPEKIKPAERVIKNTIGRVSYLNFKEMGYQDIQMIQEKLKTPAFSFGPRGGNRHQPYEWVNIADLDRVKKTYQTLISTWCSAR